MEGRFRVVRDKKNTIEKNEVSIIYIRLMEH